MVLFGQLLSGSGLNFMHAAAVHPAKGRAWEVVCATSEDAEKMKTWAKSKGLTVRVRVGTPEEVAEYERLQEIM